MRCSSSLVLGVYLIIRTLPACAALTAAEQAAIDRISAASLRGNLSFLASDAMEGRMTPSRGLDLAAEFIASQFRRAGLEPLSKEGGYFQTAKLTEITPDSIGLQLTLTAGSEELDLGAANLQIRSRTKIDLTRASVTPLPENAMLPAIEGKIVAGLAQIYGNEAALFRLQARKPKLILIIGREAPLETGSSYLEERDSSDAPVIRITNSAAADALSESQALTVTLHAAAPGTKQVQARNVGAILRGSDPALQDKYIFLTAHYDHLGMAGDRVFHGANDNGSGTVSMIEIAAAMAAMPVHPKRSIIFMAWYGEEEGLLGAYYYTRHPLVPLKDTVANINLEQMGRTDEEDGPEVGKFAFTGPSYSDLPAKMIPAARNEHVGIYVKKNADLFFDRSDNYAFALAGVVAHTVVVAFEYPDYHGLNDTWEKIDYPNMEKVDRAVAAGVIEIANATEAPKWVESKATAGYRRAGK